MTRHRLPGALWLRYAAITHLTCVTTSKMADDNLNPDSENNALGNGRTPESEARGSAVAVEGEFLPRKRRRRLDLKSLDGALREHRRIYRALLEGEMHVSVFETASRALKRHIDALGTLQQHEQLEDLRRKLADLQAPGQQRATLSTPAWAAEEPDA